MSLPPLNPEKTTAGIVVDPKTLERVVPQSKRKDGTVRKELKIRPGFTPQEDVGRFRSSRQAISESARSVVPGSLNRPSTRSQTAKADNPFAQPVASASASDQNGAKSKAQVKNEKRREKKRLAQSSTKNWDESSDEEGEDDLRGEFEVEDEKHKRDGWSAAETDPKGSEEAFPPLGRGGAPTSGAAAKSSTVGPPVNETSQTDTTQILSAVPPQAATPETASESKGAPPPPKITSKPVQPPFASISASASDSRIAAAESTSTPNRSDGDWKKAQSETQKEQQQWQRQQQRRQRQDSQKSQPSQRSQQSGQPRTTPSQTAKPIPKPEAKPEPRVRKEVKVRQGGANDLSSLASRVKNLVLENQKGSTGTRGKREGSAAPGQGAEGGAKTTA